MTIEQRNGQSESQNDLTAREIGSAFAQNENEAATQVEYRRAYVQQIKRLACPGCGEDESVF